MCAKPFIFVCIICFISIMNQVFVLESAVRHWCSPATNPLVISTVTGEKIPWEKLSFKQLCVIQLVNSLISHCNRRLGRCFIIYGSKFTWEAKFSDCSVRVESSLRRVDRNLNSYYLLFSVVITGHDDPVYIVPPRTSTLGSLPCSRKYWVIILESTTLNVMTLSDGDLKEKRIIP